MKSQIAAVRTSGSESIPESDSHCQIIFCPGHKTFDMVRIERFESGPDVYPE